MNIVSYRGELSRALHRFRLANGSIVRLSLFLAAMPARGQVSATSVAVFDKPCAKCHSEIFDKYLMTPMANASGMAVDNVQAPVLSRSYGNVAYSILSQSGTVHLHYKQVSPSIEGSRRLEYFLGSGHLGTTYLYDQDGYLLESPVAYYSGSGLDLKPGIPVTRQLAAALPVEPACLRCHMSAVQQTDQGSMNHYENAPFLHTGITCEACHGDTSSHLASRGRLAVMNPAKLEEARRDSVCISCHLEGDASVEKAGRSALDYKPGDLVSTYLAYFVFEDKDAIERGVSEIEQFNLSRCKRETGATMSCTSCHDPHFNPGPAERIEFYRAKCLTCHSSTMFVTEHHPDNRDCTGCHMSKTGASNIPHVAWTDHRILRKAAPSQSSFSPHGSKEMKPLLPAESNVRDLAMAYYQASFKAGNALQGKAYELLQGHEADLRKDPQAMDVLGNVAAARGNLAEARRDFEVAIRWRTNDFSASVNLGTLLARSGKLPQAIEIWSSSFARNKDLPGLAMNLALAQCRQGDVQAATTTLRTALDFSPGQIQLTELFRSLPSCGSSLQKTSESNR